PGAAPRHDNPENISPSTWVSVHGGGVFILLRKTYRLDYPQRCGNQGFQLSVLRMVICRLARASAWLSEAPWAARGSCGDRFTPSCLPDQGLILDGGLATSRPTRGARKEGVMVPGVKRWWRGPLTP